MKLELRPRTITEQEREKIVALVKKILTPEDKIVFAYLHGSILKDKQIRDIDIAVWLTPGTNHIDYVAELGLKIELETGIPADIQVLNNAPTTFKYIVYTSGKPLIIRNKLLHDIEVATTILMYNELQTLRRQAEKHYDVSTQNQELQG